MISLDFRLLWLGIWQLIAIMRLQISGPPHFWVRILVKTCDLYTSIYDTFTSYPMSFSPVKYIQCLQLYSNHLHSVIHWCMYTLKYRLYCYYNSVPSVERIREFIEKAISFEKWDNGKAFWAKPVITRYTEKRQ